MLRPNQSNEQCQSRRQQSVAAEEVVDTVPMRRKTSKLRLNHQNVDAQNNPDAESVLASSSTTKKKVVKSKLGHESTEIDQKLQVRRTNLRN